MSSVSGSMLGWFHFVKIFYKSFINTGPPVDFWSLTSVYNQDYKLFFYDQEKSWSIEVIWHNEVCFWSCQPSRLKTQLQCFIKCCCHGQLSLTDPSSGVGKPCSDIWCSSLSVLVNIVMAKDMKLLTQRYPATDKFDATATTRFCKCSCKLIIG